MKTIKTICFIAFTLSSVLSKAQDFNSLDLDHWKFLIEHTTYDSIKVIMPALNFNLQKETAEGTKEVFLFSGENEDKIQMIYENKKLSKIGTTVFIMGLPSLYYDLEENGYTIIDKQKVKINDKKEEAKTWGKANSAYKFTFISGGDFYSLMQIDIMDAASITNPNFEAFPPIQNFLDKIEGKKFEENSTDQQMISQSISANSYTNYSKSIQSKNTYKSDYTELNWNNFSHVNAYSLKNESKYIKYTFYFTSDVTYTLYKNGEQYANGTMDNFSCFIYTKDKEAFLKTVKVWENSRK